MTDPTPQTTPTRDEAVEAVAAAFKLMHSDTCYPSASDGEAKWAAEEIIKAYKAAVDRVNRATDAEIGGIHRSFAPAPASGGVDEPASFIWTDELYAACEAMGIPVHFATMDKLVVLWRGLTSAAQFASLSPAATPVSEAGGEPDMRRVCEALGFDPTNHHNAAKCPYCNPDQADAPKLTYRSTQATTCASCGEHKHTPLRRDEMGGYVCLTCIDKRLAALAKPASSPAGGLDVRFDALYDAFKRGVAWGREMPDAVGPEIEKGAYDYADKNTPPLSQSTSAGRVGE